MQLLHIDAERNPIRTLIATSNNIHYWEQVHTDILYPENPNYDCHKHIKPFSNKRRSFPCIL